MVFRAAVPLLFASACLAAATGAASAQQAQKPLFREGSCSGMLCDYIGGSQAPSAQQPQRSLFREGECGGMLCDAIGGSQAPRHAEPAPPCGGGILCEMMPYQMGVPVTNGDAARVQAEHARQEVAMAPAVEQATPRHRNRKTRAAVAKASAN